jgi:hypothetical protein
MDNFFNAHFPAKISITVSEMINRT